MCDPFTLGRGGRGRANRPQNPQKFLEQPSEVEQMSEGSDDETDAIRGRGAYRPLITKPQNLKTKIGKGGQEISVLTNYFRVRVPDTSLYQYDVKFDPAVESVPVRKALLYSESHKLGGAYIFDGMSDLKALHEIPPSNTFLSAVRQHDNMVIAITINFVGKVSFASPEMMRFYNTQMRRNLSHLGMQQIGRFFFETKPIGQVNYFGGVEIYQGIQTAINMHDGGLLLMMDNMCKFMRTQKAKDILLQIVRKGGDFKSAARKQLPGTIVMTKYNNKTYKIDDIDFSKNPMCTFNRGDGEVSYADYYHSQYGITITDMGQPLFIVMPNARDKRAGRDKPIFLIPELCTLTGLTEDMRKDFNFTKEVAQFTKQPPNQRSQNILGFMQRMSANQRIREEVSAWNMMYDRNLVETTARILPNPLLELREGQCPIENGEFARSMTNKKIYSPVHLARWIIICQGQDRRAADEFVSNIQRMQDKLGIQVKPPFFVKAEGPSPSHYTQAIETAKNGAQIIVCLVPNASKDRYDAIKRATIIKKKVISQVVQTPKLTGKIANSVTFKLAYQICAKINGDIWRISKCPKGVMVIGYDTYHDSSQKGRSAGGFVASSNFSMSKWYSKVNFHSAREELSSSLAKNVASAIRNWQIKNSETPKGIVLYRDGVGEGNIRYVFDYEITQVRQAMAGVPGAKDIKLTFILINKRVNARFFARRGNSVENCPPGTVVDRDITRRDRYDFYLVSQTVRQGTVTPTLCDVIADDSGVAPEILQNLTNQLTFLYYNWQGAVKVPAPCQYAHKLAFLCGQSLHEEHDPALDDFLWYL